MLYLTAALIVVGLVCVIDLVLTLGVVKRLREHSELLAGNDVRPHGLTVGDRIGPFATEDVDGDRLHTAQFAVGTLVGFFSVGCAPCRSALPKFVERARTMPGGRDQVVAVVAGAAEDAAALVADLRAVARVVVEGYQDELTTGFKVEGYPSVLTVDPTTGGRLLVTADAVNLDQPVPATAA